MWVGLPCPHAICRRAPWRVDLAAEKLMFFDTMVGKRVSVLFWRSAPTSENRNRAPSVGDRCPEI